MPPITFNSKEEKKIKELLIKCHTVIDMSHFARAIVSVIVVTIADKQSQTISKPTGNLNCQLFLINSMCLNSVVISAWSGNCDKMSLFAVNFVSSESVLLYSNSDQIVQM